MIHSLIEIITHIVLPWGGLGVFVAEVIEEIIVPIPSAVILLTSGFVFLHGPLSWGLIQTLLSTIVLPGAFGLTIGSLVIYGCTYKWGTAFIDRYGKFVGVTHDDISKMHTYVNTSVIDDWFICFARAVPLVPSIVVTVFCGVTQMSFTRYVVFTFIGSLVKASILGLLGWMAGGLYMKYAILIQKVENSVLIGLIVLFLVFVLYRRFVRKSI